MQQVNRSSFPYQDPTSNSSLVMLIIFDALADFNHSTLRYASLDHMDGRSATASIYAVIQHTLDVFKHISEAAGSLKDRERLREEVLHCESILQLVRHNVDASEEGDDWLVTTNRLSKIQVDPSPAFILPWLLSKPSSSLKRRA